MRLSIKIPLSLEGVYIKNALHEKTGGKKMVNSNVVKMCDLSGKVAAVVFVALNHGKAKLTEDDGQTYIVTDVEPKNLVYPEGWYYAKSNFRNKHNSTDGRYWEIPMRDSKGKFWDDKGARYCYPEQ